ncbi:DUF6174 domain-containing protein [Crocosphaera sp. XPORK-15E]|uniref:DUF6174 domain-containing protein n=1 Tax=Crocosphaera sp. XPORK-15E TaxID=3110247 RepID=UPI002B212CFB|nr:DUF6174 domain-containing protein [Crocosphaera sp. XPORK-15E]MEA5536472.1 DUF6174 domain-containing protein [Crocosphaera sp. XPORK-15E]
MPVNANSQESSQLITELQKNRELWRSQPLKNYQYNYQQQCFCPSPGNTPLKVSVKNGKITQVIDLKTNQAIADLTYPKTIQQLFQIIAEAIEKKAYEILVTYHSTLGYPTRIAIDYQKMLADDEVTYTVENLSKLD